MLQAPPPLEEPEEADFEPLRQELLTLYRDNIQRNTRLFAGMPELLDRLEQQGLRWGLVTNKPGWLTEPLIAALGLNDRPACVVSGDTTFLDKLDPKFVAKDLVDYKHVKAAMEKYKGWETAPGVDPANPFEREEVVKI